LKPGEEYQQALWSFGNGWAKVWDANAILLRYEASRNHDASVSFNGNMKEALGRIQAKALLLVSQTDRTIPGYLSRELYAGLKDASWVEIPTIRGHLGDAAPLPNSAEEVFLTQKIKPFLDSLNP
jgi:homoserine acetyltransferase